MKTTKEAALVWLYGVHACRMALENPFREIMAIVAINENILSKVFLNKEPEECWKSRIRIIDRQRLASLLPEGAVHQGIAVQARVLSQNALEDLEKDLSPNQYVMVLDQVSDPHNVGAILRSCAVFGAKALILTDRNAPAESGALAKSASGALESVPLIRVTNLAHALKDLKDMGFWCIGFAETKGQYVHEADLKGKVALIMGAEGEGMRRLTKDLCDLVVCLPSVSSFSTLNVSNAAAIALYETFRSQEEAFSPMRRLK